MLLSPVRGAARPGSVARPRSASTPPASRPASRAGRAATPTSRSARGRAAASARRLARLEAATVLRETAARFALTPAARGKLDGAAGMSERAMSAAVVVGDLRERAQRTIDALGSQTAADMTELVVVDIGPADLPALSTPEDLPATYIRMPGSANYASARAEAAAAGAHSRGRIPGGPCDSRQGMGRSRDPRARGAVGRRRLRLHQRQSGDLRQPRRPHRRLRAVGRIPGPTARCGCCPATTWPTSGTPSSRSATASTTCWSWTSTSSTSSGPAVARPTRSRGRSSPMRTSPGCASCSRPTSPTPA